MMASALGKNRWPPMPKCSNNSCQQECWHHVHETYVTWAIEVDELLLKEKVLKVLAWAVEVGGVLVTGNVLKVQAYRWDIFKKHLSIFINFYENPNGLLKSNKIILIMILDIITLLSLIIKRQFIITRCASNFTISKQKKT